MVSHEFLINCLITSIYPTWQVGLAGRGCQAGRSQAGPRPDFRQPWSSPVEHCLKLDFETYKCSCSVLTLHRSVTDVIIIKIYDQTKSVATYWTPQLYVYVPNPCDVYVCKTLYVLMLQLSSVGYTCSFSTIEVNIVFMC